MNELHIFNSEEFGDIRTVTIDNEPWFVGKDVATALGYKNTADAIGKHIDTDDKLTSQIAIAGQRRDVVVINESGLYALILGSKLESAKRFKSWVTKDVLPSIRKTGSYNVHVPASPLEQLQLQAQAILQVNEKVDTVKRELEDFKYDLPLLGVEMDKITNAVKTKGTKILGGKSSNAYKDNSLRAKVYKDIHGEIRRQFGVTTYKAIKRNQCETAIDLVNDYKPPIYLEELISSENAQQRMF